MALDTRDSVLKRDGSRNEGALGSKIRVTREVRAGMLSRRIVINFYLKRLRDYAEANVVFCRIEFWAEFDWGCFRRGGAAERFVYYYGSTSCEYDQCGGEHLFEDAGVG